MRWVDQALASLLGHTPAELTGRMFEEITHPEDINLDSHLAERLFAGSLATYRIQKRFVRKDKSIVRLDVQASVIRDTDGAVLYGLALVKQPDPNAPVLPADRIDAGVSEADRIRRAVLDS